MKSGEGMYYLNKIALFVANPYSLGALLLLAGLALSFSRRRRAAAIGCFCAASVWLAVWSCGFVQYVLCAAFDLDKYAPVAVEELPQADLIVDLGGSVSVKTNLFPYVELAAQADRVAHCARLWKAGKAPVVVPTGIGIAETDGVLLGEFGVPKTAIWCENEARNTEENAIFTQRLVLERLGRTDAMPPVKVLLVTSASHMRRAMMIFRKCAPRLDCIPVVVDLGEVYYLDPVSGKHFIPSPAGLAKNMVVYKECLGILGYRLRGFGD